MQTYIQHDVVHGVIEREREGDKEEDAASHSTHQVAHSVRERGGCRLTFNTKLYDGSG